jgi:hypothetical protein
LTQSAASNGGFVAMFRPWRMLQQLRGLGSQLPFAAIRLNVRFADKAGIYVGRLVRDQLA